MWQAAINYTLCVRKEAIKHEPLWLRLESVQESVLGTKEGPLLFQRKGMMALKRFRDDGMF